MGPKLVGKNKELILQAIDTLTDTNSTNIKAGLDKAYETIMNLKSRNQVTGIFLLTDGQDNHQIYNSKPTCDKIFSEWSKKMGQEKFGEIMVHTFGYGNDHDAELMNHIAKSNNGNFYYVKDLELVADSFVDCLGGLSSIIGKKMKVSLTLNESGRDIWNEIRFSRTFGAFFEPVTNGDETKRVLNLGNIYKGYKKDFMLEITLNGLKNPEILNEMVRGVETVKNSEGQEAFFTNLLKCFLEVPNLSDRVFNITKVLRTEIVDSLQENVEIKKNEEVKKNHLRVKGAEAMELACNLADNRNYDDGDKMLEDIYNELDENDDEELNCMKQNLMEQRDCIQKERAGISHGKNRRAVTKNVMNCFMEQESAPNMEFMGDMYMNKCKQVRSHALKSKRGF